MKDMNVGGWKLPFPSQHDEAEQPFKKAGRLVDEITALRVLMFKQQGIDFTPEKHAEGAHGHFQDGFHFKLGFRESPHDIDPVFDWIKSLSTKGFPQMLYTRSDYKVKHPYPHEIFLKEEDLDDLILLVGKKICAITTKTQPKIKLSI